MMIELNLISATYDIIRFGQSQLCTPTWRPNYVPCKQWSSTYQTSVGWIRRKLRTNGSSWVAPMSPMEILDLWAPLCPRWLCTTACIETQKLFGKKIRSQKITLITHWQISYPIPGNAWNRVIFIKQHKHDRHCLALEFSNRSLRVRKRKMM